MILDIGSNKLTITIKELKSVICLFWYSTLIHICVFVRQDLNMGFDLGVFCCRKNIWCYIWGWFNITKQESVTCLEIWLIKYIYNNIK